MATFGAKSQRCRTECHIKLQRVLDEAILQYDFAVIWGYRNRQEQERAFISGNSRARFGQSKHNVMPSRAFDVLPYPKGFKATDAEFYVLATIIMAAAIRVNVRIVWGGHFRTIKDLAHFELDPREL